MDFSTFCLSLLAAAKDRELSIETSITGTGLHADTGYYPMASFDTLREWLEQHLHAIPQIKTRLGNKQTNTTQNFWVGPYGLLLKTYTVKQTRKVEGLLCLSQPFACAHDALAYMRHLDAIKTSLPNVTA